MSPFAGRPGTTNTSAVLTEHQVVAIRNAVLVDGATQRSQARAYGVSEGCVWQLVTGRSWPHAPGPIREKGTTGYPNRTGALNPSAVLTEDNVVALRESIAAGARQADLARAYGISESAIYLIVRGRTWAHVGGPRIPA